MLMAIEHAEDLSADRSFEQYESDRTAKRAMERLLQIITEASIHITDEEKALCDYAHWRDMRNLGNRLRHAYFSVDDKQIWLIVKDDLPLLKAAVEQTMRDHYPEFSGS
jgi:uncharacterized protein with HEPN domain